MDGAGTLTVFKSPSLNAKISSARHACAVSGSVAGILSIELHLLKGSDIYDVWHEWTDLREGHGGQRMVGRHWTPYPHQTACAPVPGPGESLVSFVGTLPSAGYHNGSWTIKARYGWRTFTPPNQIGDPQWREVSINVNFANLLLHPDVTNPVVLAWDPEDPTKRQTRVKMELTDAQRARGEVQLKVYRLDDPAREREPLKTVRVELTVPATLVEMEWDGTDERGQVMERGLYAYDLVAWDTVPGSGGDMNQKVSSHLFIDAGTDEAGNPILEAEYAGYDDGGTPEDESDDNHLYYIRRYKLREVPVPLDNDGDLFENEDPVDGVDNDGDGAVDEDPEDDQPVRGASEGWILLYDPDL